VAYALIAVDCADARRGSCAATKDGELCAAGKVEVLTMDTGCGCDSACMSNMLGATSC